ncbi:MAG: hypothetical protein RMJ18_02915 [Candidatus Aenigmarchaeota archaeon]|nr:hypothetical protein [Candidatus Aenigmarchaeota archaeon]MCX8191122.1 hypothetical protein [Candidatus Aenigmarchaeota archaeon]MDW8160342.1 hypothetical protein [Candidatus Aenigmarchaeota archaeon]
MPSLILEDECLVPEKYLKIEYRGPNPFLAYQVTAPKFRDILQMDAPDYWERDFRWDITDDPRPFYIRIIVQKGMDSKSKIFFEIIMQGKQPKDPSKVGELTILIGARLTTEYKLNTPFQRTLFYKTLLKLYNFFFYYRVRRSYLDICRNLCEKIKSMYKELLKIE